MTRRNRMWAAFVACLIALLGVAALLITAERQPAHAAGPSAVSAAADRAPSLTPTPVFSATLRLISDRHQLLVGETLTVTASLSVSEGCQYPLMELIVREEHDGTPRFVHLQPPTDTVHPPVTMPSVWTFRAIASGAAAFTAQTFGERYCNDYWNWHYESARSDTVVVLPGSFQAWLPTIAGH